MVRVAHDIMLRGYRGCAQRQTSRSGTAYALRISRNPLCVSAVGTCRHSSGNSSAQRENRTFVTDVKHRLQLYSQLSKYRLSALVMATTSAGYLGAGGPIDAISLSCACLGTMLASSSANTFNQVIETSNDSRMKRTRSRPLPSGRISRRHALGWGFASGSAGVAVLAAGCNPLTAALGAANLALYAGPYTLSKTRSELNTWVGSVVGAVPPLMGWAAATGGVVAIEPLLMAAYLFTWQFPHFFSLAWLHREDYARGGFAMVSIVESDSEGVRSDRKRPQVQLCASFALQVAQTHVLRYSLKVILMVPNVSEVTTVERRKNWKAHAALQQQKALRSKHELPR